MQNVAPAVLLGRVEAGGLEPLRVAAGLSGAKARALVSLSEHYRDGQLSEAWLMVRPRVRAVLHI